MSFKDYFVEQQLLEAGFSRLAQIMSGLVPSVKTFAILTWENPMAQELSKEENKKRNDELKSILIKNKYGFKQIIGRYGAIENPFFIMNISDDDAKNLAFNTKANQESILYGKVEDENDVTFYLIYQDGRDPYIRHVWKDPGKSEFYSEYKGRKFYVPFFDDPVASYSSKED